MGCHYSALRVAENVDRRLRQAAARVLYEFCKMPTRYCHSRGKWESNGRMDEP